MAGSGQSYVERPPVAALAGIVSSVWIQQVAPGADAIAHRNVPNGGVELLCRVGAVPRVVGPLTQPLAEVLAPGTTVVGVRFHPGAAPPALGLPASELVDLALDADEVWGRSAVALGEHLALLAAEAGYADQPHLNRECLRLTGVSPRTFVGEAEDRCACGHDHAASFAPLLRSRPL